MPEQPTLWWIRLDFRLADNAALMHAIASGGPVVPVFVFSPEEEGAWPPGGASRWWLHQSLVCLQHRLEQLGVPLIIRRGPMVETLDNLAQQTGAKALVFHRRYEPVWEALDASVIKALASQLTVTRLPGNLLFEPEATVKQDGTPYKVYTPFWKYLSALPEPEAPLLAPPTLTAYANRLDTLPLDSLGLMPKVAWYDTMASQWQPGEVAAQRLLQQFVEGLISVYQSDRDRPDKVGTSRLSPHLHFGEVTPRQIWHAVRQVFPVEAKLPDGPKTYLKEVVWREFAHHLLVHFPQTPWEPFRPEFQAFPVVRDEALLEAWRRGKTGYPIVDAGMRELWATGWMHNRVRMVVASFLVKHLLQPWQEGALWFWDTLVDADLASNTLGWQWAAGCGADAAPYFRVFNPILQGLKFDPNGHYVRRWVPELSKLPDAFIHKPWEAPPLVAYDAGVVLGETYPQPLVEHAFARSRALKAWETFKAVRS